MNKQRETIYGMRRQLMSNENVSDQIYDMIEEICEGFVDEYAPEKVYPEEWELNSLKNRVFETFFFHINFDSIDFKAITKQGLLEMVKDSAFQTYHKKEADFGEQEFRALERFISLNSLDTHWKEHLLALDHLKEGIGLRGYGQKDPLREYQKESFELFLDMLEQSKLDTVRKLYAVQPAREELTRDEPVMFFNKTDEALSMQKDKKIGRNDPCPCGSGKKYKKCCGR